MDSYKHLSLAERVELKIGLAKGDSLRHLARCLGRDASTFCRERKRACVGAVAYDPDVATRLALLGRRRAGRKLQPGTLLWDGMIERLRCGWSPEQIAGGLKHEHSNEPVKRVSHETIYRALYALPKGELKKELLGLLRQAGRSRRPRSCGKKRGAVLKDITPIAARPAEVEARLIPGHWEADLIKGLGNKSAVATLVERTTRLTLLAQELRDPLRFARGKRAVEDLQRCVTERDRDAMNVQAPGRRRSTPPEPRRNLRDMRPRTGMRRPGPIRAPGGPKPRSAARPRSRRSGGRGPGRG